MTDEVQNAIEAAIQKAIRGGIFDNLPGKGKPLKLEQNPHENPDWSLAFRLLRENDFTLPWIADRQEIEAELMDARRVLARHWERANTDPENVPDWEQAKENFRKKVKHLNRRIRDYNLNVPATNLQRPGVNAETEIDQTAHSQS